MRPVIVITLMELDVEIRDGYSVNELHLSNYGTLTRRRTRPLRRRLKKLSFDVDSINEE
jgi:hypothetical protein